jgi:hypothetical protein
MDNKDNIGELIYRSIKDMSYTTAPRKEADSVEINYNFNSYGYRCNEFNNQEILILGCSHTEGHGLPVELTWPYLLSKTMNQDYINLAKGGEGAQAQVTKAFQFFKEFYNPKYIFAVFPLARLEVPLFNMKVTNPSSGNIGKGIFSNKKIKKYSKAPHVAEEVLTEEFAVFYNILFIKMLIQYCESNNIKLIWSYYTDMQIEMPLLNDLHNGYFESSYLNSIISEKCHLEFSNNQFFDYAADYDYWPPGHWGFHQQLHIAESIYNML